MTYPPGTRVRVTFDGLVGSDGCARVDDPHKGNAVAGGMWLAANPDNVTVLLDEPADGGVVLDRAGDAWQRMRRECVRSTKWWATDYECHPQPRSWDSLVADRGPLAVIHAGGE